MKKLHPKAIEYIRNLNKKEFRLDGKKAPVTDLDMILRKGRISRREEDELVSAYNFRKAFLYSGNGSPFNDGQEEERLTVDLNGDFYRRFLRNLSVLLDRATESAMDFLPILEDDLRVAEENNFEENILTLLNAQLEDFSAYTELVSAVSEEVTEKANSSDANQEITMRISKRALLEYMMLQQKMIEKSLDTISFLLQPENEEDFEDNITEEDPIDEDIIREFIERKKGLPS